MQQVSLDESFFSGAVSVERLDGALRPWRLPHDRLELFPSPGDALIGRAMESSGVRLRLRTDAPALSLKFLPLRGEPLQEGHSLDLTLDGELAATVQIAPGATAATFGAFARCRQGGRGVAAAHQSHRGHQCGGESGVFLRAGTRPASAVDHLRQLADPLPPRATVRRAPGRRSWHGGAAGTSPRWDSAATAAWSRCWA